MSQQRLLKQIEFIKEIDKLKTILRQTMILDKSRNENDAEHTWHLTIMAIVLLEHANEPTLDILRILKMLIIHDIVEIDAGDTFAYDESGHQDKSEREIAAAKRLFGLLPEDQGNEFYSLWREFEERTTSESRYAAAIDRLQPLILNYHTEGVPWKKYGVTKDRVIARNQQLDSVSKELWNFAEKLINDSVEKGFLEEM